MACLGIDPGLNGALAFYSKDVDYMSITDMPSYMATVGKKKRKRLDAVDLLTCIEQYKRMGATLAVIEQVGGRPKQGASAGFVFGYTVGMVMMACVAVRIPVETVAPAVWKKLLRVPGGKEADDETILQRADQMMPGHGYMWRGDRGGRKLDRAEAAMLAYYGETFAVDRVSPDMVDHEYRLVYDKALGDAD